MAAHPVIYAPMIHADGVTVTEQQLTQAELATIGQLNQTAGILNGAIGLREYGDQGERSPYCGCCYAYLSQGHLDGQRHTDRGPNPMQYTSAGWNLIVNARQAHNTAALLAPAAAAAGGKGYGPIGGKPGGGGAGPYGLGKGKGKGKSKGLPPLLNAQQLLQQVSAAVANAINILQNE